MDEPEHYLRTGFLERLAHELKGPVGVTLGVLDELESTLASDPARTARLLGMARRSSQRLLGVADRLHRTAQLERGVDWRRERQDLREAVEHAVARARELETRRGVELDLVRAGSACFADLDVIWVTSAVSELLFNALRNARSRVVVTTSQVADHVGVCVSDDGQGFRGPVAPRFAPASRPQGLGLALCLVEDVARAHGGSLDFDGESGPGCRVTLQFPAAAAERTAPAQSA